MAAPKGNNYAKGKGRPSKAEEQQTNVIILGALKKLYSVNEDIEAKEQLVTTLMESQRGQIFIAEHLFGKPKELVETTVNVNEFNIKDVIRFKE